MILGRIGKHFAPEGGTGAGQPAAHSDATPDALTAAIGGPEASSRPDLAEMERKERERLGKAKPDAEAPLVPPRKEKPPVAARETAPAKEETSAGEEPEPDTGAEADPTDDAVQAILSKYSNRPESLAKAIKNLQRLQGTTAESKKAAEAEVARLTRYALAAERDYDEVDGELVIRPEAAAKALQKRRGLVPPKPKEDAIRAEVEKRFRDKLAETIHPEDIEAVLETSFREEIENVVGLRMKQAATEHYMASSGVEQELAERGRKHLSAHPEDKDVWPAVVEFFAPFPDEIRGASIIENWTPLERVAQLLRIEHYLPQIVKQSVAKGIEIGRGTVEATDAAPPAGGGRLPGKSGSMADADAKFKESILRPGGGLPTFDSLVGR